MKCPHPNCKKSMKSKQENYKGSYYECVCGEKFFIPRDNKK